MASSPLPQTSGVRAVSPVCVVSGLPEAQLAALRDAVCAEAAALLGERRGNVEALALGDPRIMEDGRMIAGLHIHVEGAVVTINAKTFRAGMTDDRIVPTPAFSAPFSAKANGNVTPQVREALRRALAAQGLL